MGCEGTKKSILLLGDARQVHLKRWSTCLIENGYDVLTVSLEAMEKIPGEKRRIIITGALPDAIRYPMAVPRIKRWIRDYKPDLINAHYVPNYGVIAALAGFTPWVLSTWGSDIMVLPDKNVFQMLRTKYVLRAATYITSDARIMTERLVALGADRARICTFPYGVDLTSFYPAVDGRDGQGPRILSNRKLEPVYDIQTIIDAALHIKARIPESTFTVAGTGSLHRSLISMAGERCGEATIRFIGEVTHEKMPELLRSHDIFVSMARSDTTSVSLLEAMACGLFPIVSDIPANREWIDHGANGFLVSPGNAQALAVAVAEAWTNAALRTTAQRRNEEIIRSSCDWRQNMEMAMDVFERAIAHAAGAAAGSAGH
jgi:glycosyltransferase involved in cell wall biosynthesis